MKNRVIILKSACTAFLCAGFVLGCKTDDSLAIDPAPSGDVISADTISDHLRFVNDEKIVGEIPKRPSGSSLQISFKDTLYLHDEVLVPIKFRHEDVSEDVTGVYFQVFSGGTGGAYYYDVPETPQKAENDSVSIIMVGIDPTGIVEPHWGAAGPGNLEIIISPHGPDGQPIATATRPVKISVPQFDSNGSCSIVNPPGEFWSWTSSWDGSEVWGPETVFGAKGQDILGCCVNGVSISEAACLNENPEDQRKLRFPTSYQIMSEDIVFIHNGTFIRNTFEKTTAPEPFESDFCGTGPGVVKRSIKHVNYEGNWTINTVTPVPPLDDTFLLRMASTSSTGFGFGNRGGFIHQLDCEIGVLILIDFDGEGGYVAKFYDRVNLNRPVIYYPFG